MNCPHCDYEPDTNEFDYCGGAGRFFTLGIEMKQETNPHSMYANNHEPIIGCPNCGILFMNMGYNK